MKSILPPNVPGTCFRVLKLQRQRYYIVVRNVLFCQLFPNTLFSAREEEGEERVEGVDRGMRRRARARFVVPRLVSAPKMDGDFCLLATKILQLLRGYLKELQALYLLTSRKK